MGIDYNKLVINLINDSKKIIPYDHQYYLHAYILSELKSINIALSNELYNSKIPYFVMSQLIPSGNAHFDKLGFYSGKLVLIINSSNSDLLNYIKKIFDEGQIISLKELNLRVHSSHIFKPELSTYLPELSSRSPVIIKYNNRYVGYGDKDFEAILKLSIQNKVEKILQRPIKIDGLKITYGKRKLSHIHNSPITSSIIKFVILSDLDVIKTILCCGVGKSTQLGYGMVDIND